MSLDTNLALEVLGLKNNTTQEEIKKSYRKLVKIWHPDRFTETHQKLEAEAKLKQINEAYEALESYQPSSINSKTPINSSSTNKETSIERKANNAETFYNWGVKSAKEGKYNDALNYLSRAICLNPYYIEAYKYRGWICSVLGYENRANTDFNKVRELERRFKTTDNPISSRQSKYNENRIQRKKPKFWIKKICYQIQRFFLRR
jgi:tetratricopeptide (TPR) repeat protein